MVKICFLVKSQKKYVLIHVSNKLPIGKDNLEEIIVKNQMLKSSYPKIQRI
jgi:hypothetical protein